MKRPTIFIYDDNIAAVTELKGCIEAFFQGRGIVPEIRCFDTYSQAENLLSSGQCSCDAFFLDIELDKGKNGIEFADMLSRLYPEIKIVFVTGFSDKYSQAIFMQSSALRPYGYVSKPVDKAVVGRILSLMMTQDSQDNERCISLSSNKQELKIKCNEILYIESFKRKLIFYLRDGTVKEIYGKISEIADDLPKGFLQCHRSYIVNADYIHTIDEKNGQVDLVNGATLFLGRTKKVEFMESFFRYKGGI